MTGRDWTTTSAKWAAVVVLGGASIAGLAWSMSRPGPATVRTDLAVEAADRPETPAVPPSLKLETTRMAAIPPAAPAPEQGHADAPKPGAVETEANQEATQPIAPGSHQINLNTATQAELELLPGIGPALAKRILEFRSTNGKFASVDDLDKVKGIGVKTLAKLRPLVKAE